MSPISLPAGNGRKHEQTRAPKQGIGASEQLAPLTVQAVGQGELAPVPNVTPKFLHDIS